MSGAATTAAIERGKRLGGNGTHRVFPVAGRRANVAAMEPTSPAEELPALYRALLDQVAQIEADGRRAAAYRLRSEAVRIYSKSWDDRARRALQELLGRAQEPGVAEPQPELAHGTPQGSVTAA